jgi:hypothetical protein
MARETIYQSERGPLESPVGTPFTRYGTRDLQTEVVGYLNVKSMPSMVEDPNINYTRTLQIFSVAC